MTTRYRLRKIEKTVAAREGLRGDRETLWWNPSDQENGNTKLVFEQVFNTPHTQRKFNIRILGEPPRRVFHALAKEILPEKENLKNLSDEELQSCMEKYQQACHNAINESRAKQGLPPMPAGVAEKTIGRE